MGLRLNPPDWDHVLEDFDDLVDDVASANHHTFQGSLERLMAFINTDKALAKLTRDLTKRVDFDAWYSGVKKPPQGTSSKNKLDWPTDKKDLVSCQLGLLNQVARKQETVPDFCFKFMSSSTHYDDMVFDFYDQIVRPFAREYRKILERSYSKPQGEKITLLEFSVAPKTERFISDWGQKIVIGVVVTVLGGLFLAALLG